MVPGTKEQLHSLVTDTAAEVYEDLTPQLIRLIEETHHNNELFMMHRSRMRYRCI